MYLIDNNELGKGGHNFLYMHALLNIEGTIKYNKVKRFDNYKKNPLKAIKQRKKYYKYFNDKKCIHILHFDAVYLGTSIFKKLKKNNVKIIATLHWYPTREINRKILKRTAKYIDIIVVHSEFIKANLKSIGINNVVVVDYPAFVSEEISNKLSNNKSENDKIIVSCLGGTRYDKGLDILIDAFKYFDSTVKENIIFNVAGYEQDIKYDYLMQESQKYDVNVTATNKVLTELEYWENINNSDVILLPYRKIFAGNSGPMTDGVYMNKYIIGPHSGNIGYLIEKYDLGLTFKSEDSSDLARIIKMLPKKDIINNNNKYREQLGLDKFIDNYCNLYKEIY